MYGCETWATTKYLLSRLDAFDTWALRKMLRIPYTRHVWNAEVRRITGCSLLSHLVSVSSAILLAAHLARTTIEPLQCVSDKYRPTGSDQQEDLATLGSVQLRQTLALWTLASRLPGERPLLETNGDILWTQQRSSGVRSERRRRISSVTCANQSSVLGVRSTAIGRRCSLLHNDSLYERPGNMWISRTMG